MIAIGRRTRTTLLFLSAACYVAWFSGLGDLSDAAGFASQIPVAAPTPHFVHDPNIATVIARDPFAGAPTPGHDGSVPPAAPAAPETPEKIVGSVAGQSVPDIGATGAEAPLPLIVRATIVGSNPVAYVENGSVMNIVRIGDTLGDERVARIDLGGLTFGDGSRLDLPGAAPPTSPPAPRQRSVGERFDEIRSMLARLRLAPPSVAGVALPLETPTPQPAAPTPAPLRTVDGAGIPVGVNPTPDLSGPTAYPDPYPYAPPAHH